MLADAAPALAIQGGLSLAPAASRPRRSLTATRARDFRLIGGASLVTWVVLFAVAPLRHSTWAINQSLTDIAGFSAIAALFINYPHFIMSYKLAYGQGWRFPLRIGGSWSWCPCAC